MRPVAHLPQGARRETRAERPAARGDRVSRQRVRRGGRRDGQDRRARRALRRERRRRRARHRLAARDHVHRTRGRRAARAHPGAPDRTWANRSRARARRRVGFDDSRLLSQAARDVPARGACRPGVPGARRAAGARAAGRGVHDGARAFLRRRRTGSLAAARDLWRRRASADARRGVRDPSLGWAGARARAWSPRAARRPCRGAPRGGGLSRRRCACDGDATRRGRGGPRAHPDDDASRAAARARRDEGPRPASGCVLGGARRPGRRGARGACLT